MGHNLFIQSFDLLILSRVATPRLYEKYRAFSTGMPSQQLRASGEQVATQLIDESGIDGKPFTVGNAFQKMVLGISHRSHGTRCGAVEQRY